MIRLFYIWMSAMLLTAIPSGYGRAADYDSRLQSLASIMDEHNWDARTEKVFDYSLSDFSTRGDSALYILLYCRTQHCSGTVLPLNSLLPFAADYYSTTGETSRSMMAWYLRACSYFDNGRREEATYFAAKMREYADSIGNHLYLARYHDIMGSSLSSASPTGLSEAAGHYAEALREFREIFPPDFSMMYHFYNNAYSSWMRASMADSALSLCRYMTPIMQDDSVAGRRQNWSENYILASIRANDIKDKSDFWEGTRGAYVELDSSGVKYNRESARHKVYNMLVKGVEADDTTLLMEAKRLAEENGIDDIFEESGDYQIRNDVDVSASGQSINAVEQTDAMVDDGNTLRNWLLAGAAGIIVIIAAALTACYVLAVRRERRLFRQLNELHAFEEEVERGMASGKVIAAHLYADRLRRLNILCDNFFCHRASDKRAKATFCRKFEQQLDELGSRESIGEIERQVNELKDNPMAKLRAQMPRLKQADLDLLIYTFAGFSARAICFLSGISKRQYYRRRRRLIPLIELSLP